MSRKANVLSLSNTFIEGISPGMELVAQNGLFAHVPHVRPDLPLTILQKMHAAAMVPRRTGSAGRELWSGMLITVYVLLRDWSEAELFDGMGAGRRGIGG